MRKDSYSIDSRFDRLPRRDEESEERHPLQNELGSDR